MENRPVHIFVLLQNVHVHTCQQNPPLGVVVLYKTIKSPPFLSSGIGFYFIYIYNYFTS